MLHTTRWLTMMLLAKYASTLKYASMSSMLNALSAAVLMVPLKRGSISNCTINNAMNAQEHQFHASTRTVDTTNLRISELTKNSSSSTCVNLSSNCDSIENGLPLTMMKYMRPYIAMHASNVQYEPCKATPDKNTNKSIKLNDAAP